MRKLRLLPSLLSTRGLGLRTVITAGLTLLGGAVNAAAPGSNPFLADSNWPISHADSAQTTGTYVAAPRGVTKTLSAEEIDYRRSTYFHLGMYISGPYAEAEGKRVIWSNGADRIIKLDYDTMDVLSEYQLTKAHPIPEGKAEEVLNTLETAGDWYLPAYTLTLRNLLKDISGMYAMLDKDNNYYLAGSRSITVYGDVDEGNPKSAIAPLRTFNIPENITGTMVGMNMTADGWVVLATTNGDVVTVSRDFSEMHHAKLTFSEQADPSLPARSAWVRNSFALDKSGGIYVVSNDHMHKMVWTGETLSTDEADGAWAVPYRNSTTMGSGSTPSLMGFGDDDKFVVITDGDKVMNLTLFWRDGLPKDWQCLEGAKSCRVAGYLPVNFGDASLTEVQSEQSAVVSGYGAAVVNNEPQHMPFYYPKKAKQLLVGYLNGRPEYQPYGVQKFVWNPQEQQLEAAWVNNEVSSPNGVPTVSGDANMFYTVGARDGLWTVEGVDWDSGKSEFHYVVGGEQYNSFFAALEIDGDGRFMFGTMWGVVRINVKP